MLRSLITALAALALLMQALAPAHALMTLAAAEPAAVEDVLPCHGAEAVAARHDEGPMPCCPGETCACAQMCHSAPALAQSQSPVPVTIEQVAQPGLPAARAASAHSHLLLRPPITA